MIDKSNPGEGGTLNLYLKHIYNFAATLKNNMLTEELLDLIRGFQRLI